MREIRYPELWILAGVALLGGFLAFVFKPQPAVSYLDPNLQTDNEIAYVQYAGGVRIGRRYVGRQAGIGTFDGVWTSAQTFSFVVDDGKGTPVHFTYKGTDETPFDPLISDGVVVIPMMGQHGFLVGHYVVDRVARLASFIGGFPIAFMSNGEKVVTTDAEQGGLRVTDAFGNELQFLKFKPDDAYLKSPGMVSPDDTRVAFIAPLFGYPEINKARIYIYDIESNRIDAIGETEVTESFRWKDDVTLEFSDSHIVNGESVPYIYKTVNVP